MVIWILLYDGPSRSGPLLEPSESIRAGTLDTNPHQHAALFCSHFSILPPFVCSVSSFLQLFSNLCIHNSIILCSVVFCIYHSVILRSVYLRIYYSVISVNVQ
jgi:hypothetical protein